MLVDVYMISKYFLKLFYNYEMHGILFQNIKSITVDAGNAYTMIHIHKQQKYNFIDVNSRLLIYIFYHL